MLQPPQGERKCLQPSVGKLKESDHGAVGAQCQQDGSRINVHVARLKEARNQGSAALISTDQCLIERSGESGEMIDPTHLHIRSALLLVEQVR